MSPAGYLKAEPGRYAVTWFIGDRTVPGEVELEALQPPTLKLFDDVQAIDWKAGVGLPVEHEREYLTGRLRNNADIVVRKAGLSTLFPGHCIGHGQYAVVGLGVAETVRYARVRLQISGADLLFGMKPLEAITWPKDITQESGGQYCATVSADARREWRDDEENITFKCSYDLSFSFSNGYRYELSFAPIVSISSETPLSVEEWIEGWINPLLRVTALATRTPQRLAWVTVHAGAEDEDPRKRSASGAVFGSGIEQVVYQAQYQDEWRDANRRPLFTLRDLPVPLPVLLRTWRIHEADKNPFFELYRLVLFQPDMPARARFLYLVQALEALHALENRSRDEKSQKVFEEKWTAILESFKVLDVNPSTVRFLRANWSKRRPESLDHRLAALLKALPPKVGDLIRKLDMGEIGAELTKEGAATLHAQLRALRNHLSHGQKNYEASALRPWTQILEFTCRAHLLRLLGFDPQAVDAAVGRG